MELKLARDELDEYQIRTRKKLPLTGLDLYFSSMRDRTHSEQVIRWAKYVKSHPRSVWIKEVKPLIDSQMIMANNFYERLAKTQGGIEKIRKLRDLR